jgi:hypothetical protein
MLAAALAGVCCEVLLQSNSAFAHSMRVGVTQTQIASIMRHLVEAKGIVDVITR